jgi:hypothetical protein
MKKTVFSFLMISIGSVSQAFASPSGPAGELALHKLERLVTLKKIDASYETQSTSVSVTPSGTGFNVSIMQAAGADGKMNTLMMTSDKDGKVLTYMAMPANPPVSPLSLPGKSSVNLLELSMHCIEGEMVECKANADIGLYNDHFKAASFSVVKDAAGKITGGEIAITGDALPKTLLVNLNNDGSFKSISEK